MSHDIDFSELLLRDVLDLAVSIEEEAKERWGDSLSFQQSVQRTSSYSKAEWEKIKAEMDGINRDFSSFVPQLVDHFKSIAGAPLRHHWLK